VPKRALLIVNRKSRNGAGDINVFTEHLASRAVEVLLRMTERPDQIPALIERHATDVDCVIIGGGDGSLNAAAGALAAARLPLGVLPLGTANDLARTLKIPVEPAEAGKVITDGILHRIDLGRVNDRFFFNVAHIGLGVRAREHLSGDVKRRWGALSYARALFRTLGSFRPFHADIECDGQTSRLPSIHIAVGNGRHYGGGMTVSENASIDDRLLFLYSIEPLGAWQLLKCLPALRTGRFEEWHPVVIAQGRRIRIATRRKLNVSADGEVVSSTPATFDLIPGAISVFVPEAYFESRKDMTNVAQG